jgi:methylated-DNA-[protein]-cysteine S-methyltransferase
MSNDETPQFDAVIGLPFGRFGICIDHQGATVDALAFLPIEMPLLAPEHPLAALAQERIEAWIDDPKIGLTLPLTERGTPFQRRLRAILLAIPLGQTRTYNDIAKEMGSSPRAVGQACANNPFPLIVPCHRVVATGRIGGFAHARSGDLITVKRWLLTLEAQSAGIKLKRGGWLMDEAQSAH